MKKFLLCVMILTLAAGAAFAGVDPYVYVDVDNIEIASGGNVAVGGSYNVDVVKSKGHLANSHSGFSFAEIYAHQKFKGAMGDKNSEYYLSKNYPSATLITIKPKGKHSAQIKAKSVPTKKVLLNANAPITLTSYSDKIILTFGREADEFCNTEFVNVIDDKGKVIATLQGLSTMSSNNLNENHVIEFKVTSKYKNYYLEFKDYDTKKFYYVLLKIKATDYPAKENKLLSKYDREDEAQHNSQREIINDYMSEHNINDEHSLTEQDYEAIVGKVKTKQYENAKPVNQKMTDAMNDYMKKHGIKDFDSLTQKDLDAIGKAFKASLTPAELKRFQAEEEIRSAYMKKHSISDPSKMTQKDYLEIQKEIERTLGK